MVIGKEPWVGCMQSKYHIFPAPEKLIASAYSLEQLGINNVAWNYHDIMQVIDYLAQHDYIILGGDVYLMNVDKIESTYDSWYINKTSLSHTDFVRIAQGKSVDYINNYHVRNGNQYLYSLVVEDRSKEAREYTSGMALIKRMKSHD